MHLVIAGGSDAGIEAGLRARELDPAGQVTMLVADAYPNFSICGIPYHVSGEVPDWRSLAHRSVAELEATGMRLRLGAAVTGIDPAGRTVTVNSAGRGEQVSYDRLVVATGAAPARPPIEGVQTLGAADGVHVLHSMDDTFALTASLTQRGAGSAVIVGAGYIGMEMAEALTTLGLGVSVLEQLPQVMPNTLDSQLAAHAGAELQRHGVEVHTGTTVAAVTRDTGALAVAGEDGQRGAADVVLVAVGVRPESALAAQAGAQLGAKGAIGVDRRMRTSLPDVYAAGDCAETYHRLLKVNTYLPLGTTAHKQGRVAGDNAAGGEQAFAGSLGTQVVRVFDLVIAATGLRDPQAAEAGFDPVTVEALADNHKAYYPGATPIRVRLTGDRASGRLLGAQLLGHVQAEVAKRADVLATALSYGATVGELTDLDLSYTPPLGSPWDAVQHAAQAWTRGTATAASRAGR